MSGLDELLDELERILAEVETFDEPVRDRVFALLDGFDALHRHALGQLGELLDRGERERLRESDPAVEWLFAAYSVGIDERAAAGAALGSVRPYIPAHGGDVSVVDAHDGVVRVRLSGACSGCPASTVTLRRGVEEALRDGFAG